jgi:dihydrofolate synthase/folylpolyglutamate synthase
MRTRATDLTLDYRSAVAALQARGRFGISLGLERVERLLDELGRPERNLHGALVGGTNGKGSVVAMVRSVLQAAGLRVGTMPKPHLVSYRERIAIDGEPVTRTRFAAAISDVLPAIDRVAADVGPPTEFEALTAAAMLELSRSAIDLAVVEVGMGGRLDATNVLDLGVAAITNVQHDHERYLGSTLARIGAEKAGIIKRGDLAVTGASGRGLAPIVERCTTLNVPLRRVGTNQGYRPTLRHSGWDGIVLDLATPARMLDGLRVRLLGGHQASNAAVAVAVLDALGDDGARRGAPLPINDGAIRDGLQRVSWPGRLELLDGRRLGLGRVLLDGAHNPAGAAALTRALTELGLQRMPMVFGAMRGKRVHAVLRALATLKPRPVFAAVDEPGAWSPAALLGIWKALGESGGSVAKDPADAMHVAGGLVRRGEPIVVAGSLYLVGSVRAMLTGEEA